MANVCRSMNAVDVRVAKDEAEADALRTARRSALSALARLKPTTILEDATVPRCAELLRWLKPLMPLLKI